MKTFYSILFLLTLLAISKGADPISIDEFKKMKYPDQVKAFDAAPPEMKAKLLNIFAHSYLLQSLGGEEQLKNEKETRIIEERGLLWLEMFYETQDDLWQVYAGAAISASQRSGMPLEKQAEVQKQLNEESDAINKQFHEVHQLVFRVAASPQALELAKKVETRVDEIRKTYNIGQATPQIPITKEQITDLDKEADQLLEEIKKLPRLTPAQAQKEYDAFPDSKVPKW